MKERKQLGFNAWAASQREAADKWRGYVHGPILHAERGKSEEEESAQSSNMHYIEVKVLSYYIYIDTFVMDAVGDSVFLSG